MVDGCMKGTQRRPLAHARYETEDKNWMIFLGVCLAKTVEENISSVGEGGTESDIPLALTHGRRAHIPGWLAH